MVFFTSLARKSAKGTISSPTLAFSSIHIAIADRNDHPRVSAPTPSSCSCKKRPMHIAIHIRMDVDEDKVRSHRGRPDMASRAGCKRAGSRVPHRVPVQPRVHRLAYINLLAAAIARQIAGASLGHGDAGANRPSRYHVPWSASATFFRISPLGFSRDFSARPETPAVAPRRHGVSLAVALMGSQFPVPLGPIR